MKFLGLFGASYVLIFLILMLVSPLLENIYGIIAIAALPTALVLRLFMGQSERLDQLEHELRLAQKTLTELSDRLPQDDRSEEQEQ